MAACAKLHEMQFLCIAKRVTVNDVNSDKNVAEKDFSFQTQCDMLYLINMSSRF